MAYPTALPGCGGAEIAARDTRQRARVPNEIPLGLDEIPDDPVFRHLLMDGLDLKPNVPGKGQLHDGSVEIAVLEI